MATFTDYRDAKNVENIARISRVAIGNNLGETFYKRWRNMLPESKAAVHEYMNGGRSRIQTVIILRANDITLSLQEASGFCDWCDDHDFIFRNNLLPE